MKTGNRTGLSLPILAAAVLAIAACAAWFGYRWYIETPGYHQKKLRQQIYEQYADDEHFAGIGSDGRILFDYDFTDIFHNQSLSDCTHDLSYTEPVIPVGKYYPDGDASREYYVEITEENGEYFFEYKNADGTPYGPTNDSDPFYKNTGKHRFVVITDHSREETYVTTSWVYRDDLEEDEYSDMWPGEKVLFGDLDIRFQVYFDEDGNASMDLINFVSQSSEDRYRYTQSDREKGFKLKLPI